jgi:hypothetical protein
MWFPTGMGMFGARRSDRAKLLDFMEIRIRMSIPRWQCPLGVSSDTDCTWCPASLPMMRPRPSNTCNVARRPQTEKPSCCSGWFHTTNYVHNPLTQAPLRAHKQARSTRFGSSRVGFNFRVRVRHEERRQTSDLKLSAET